MIYTKKERLRFEWDAQKAEANLIKHGIAFLQATEVFDDPFALAVIDEKHSTVDELRELIIGEIEPGIVMVVFTARAAGEVFRIISARKASRSEKRRYEQNKTISL